jgi:hypothetical protein
MSAPSPNRQPLAMSLVWLVGGSLALVLAWLMPVNLTSVTVPLVERAGYDTLSLSQAGLHWAQSEKTGPAALLLRAAENLGDPGVPELKKSLATLLSGHPELLAWGGYDPFLEPLLKLRANQGRTASTPVIELLVTGEARQALRSYLVNSRSLGVQALLRLREIPGTGRFVPANRPGGQTLDTLILVSALLYQGEHLSPPLQRELRSLTESALHKGQLGELESVFLNLLSLSRRLDWIQLCELLRRTEDFKTMGEYAHLARVAPDDFALIYAAALFSESSDRVASYLLLYGKAGLEDLRFSLSHGQGATRLLLERQLPINRTALIGPGAVAEFGLLYPRLAIIVRWVGFVIGAFSILRGCDKLLFRTQPGFGPALPHAKSGILALLLAGLFAIATEPFLLKGAPLSEFKVRLSLPALATTSVPPNPSKFGLSFTTMDASTLLSIGFFAALQIAMYLICLMKIREIARQPHSPFVKLKLMENEENLFDGGLYIGIGGTATALVLQVLQIIEPNLLAAYSSNLFGITCVALVKIRHVRPYKRALIIEGQVAVESAAPKAAPVPTT